MSVSFRARPVKTLDREISRKLLPIVARAVTMNVRRLARQNFRNRSGQLYKTIRTEVVRGRALTAIGNKTIHYWRFVRNFTRGDGRRWLIRAGRDRISNIIANSAPKAGLR